MLFRVCQCTHPQPADDEPHVCTVCKGNIRNHTPLTLTRLRELNMLSEWNRSRQPVHTPKVDPDRAH